MVERRRLLRWAVAAAVLVVLLFARTAVFHFVNYDDDQILTKNEVVLHFDVAKMLTTDAAHDYIPLTLFSYALENSVVGLRPWLYHLDNVLLHLINTILILFLSFRVLRGRVTENLRVPLSGIIALFFAIHPLHVESVAWVTQRKDVLSGLFYLLALLFYLRFLDLNSKRHLVFVFLFFVASCVSKSMSVTLPAVLVLFDFLEKRKITKEVIIEKIPFFAVTIGLAILHLRLHDTADLEQLPVIAQAGPLGRGFNSLTFYFEKCFLPFNLAAFYSLKAVALEWADYLAAGVVVFLLGAMVKFLWPNRLGVFGVAFFLISLSPAIQVVPFGNFIAFGDHYVYLPIWGFMILLAAVVSRWGADDKTKLKMAAGVAAFVFVLYEVLAWQRVSVWKNSELLWKDVISRYPTTRDAHFNLAGAYFFEEGRYNEAIDEYLKTLTIDPHFAYAHFNMGLLYHKTNRDDMAIALFKKSLEIYADMPEAHFNLALLYRNRGQLGDARREVQEGLKLKPDHAAGRKLEQELK